MTDYGHEVIVIQYLIISLRIPLPYSKKQKKTKGNVPVYHQNKTNKVNHPRCEYTIHMSDAGRRTH